jgi:hypothetical protein
VRQPPPPAVARAAAVVAVPHPTGPVSAFRALPLAPPPAPILIVRRRTSAEDRERLEELVGEHWESFLDSFCVDSEFTARAVLPDEMDGSRRETYSEQGGTGF